MTRFQRFSLWVLRLILASPFAKYTGTYKHLLVLVLAWCEMPADERSDWVMKNFPNYWLAIFYAGGLTAAFKLVTKGRKIPPHVQATFATPEMDAADVTWDQAAAGLKQVASFHGLLPDSMR